MRTRIYGGVAGEEGVTLPPMPVSAFGNQILSNRRQPPPTNLQLKSGHPREQCACLHPERLTLRLKQFPPPQANQRNQSRSEQSECTGFGHSAELDRVVSYP